MRYLMQSMTKLHVVLLLFLCNLSTVVFAEKYSLTVNATPSDSRIRIMNIKPKYHDGIRLLPGSYKIVVDKSSYSSKTKWIKIKNQDKTIQVVLQTVEDNHLVADKKTDAEGFALHVPQIPPKTVKYSEYYKSNRFLIADKSHCGSVNEATCTKCFSKKNSIAYTEMPTGRLPRWGCYIKHTNTNNIKFVSMFSNATLKMVDILGKGSSSYCFMKDRTDYIPQIVTGFNFLVYLEYLNIIEADVATMLPCTPIGW